MANRMKPKAVESIRSNQEVDDAFFRIAQLRLLLKGIDADAEERINKIKAEAVKKAEPYRAEIEKLSNGIFVYAEYEKNNLFDKKRSVELNFGVFGYRRSSSIHVKKTTLELLKQLGFSQAINVKEMVNKEVLGGYDDETLAKVDASREEKDEFWFEVKEQAITETLPKTTSAA